MKHLREGREAGSVLVMVALLLPILCALAMMGMDFGRAYMEKSTLQNVADAAALAGVAEVSEGRARLVTEEDVPKVASVAAEETVKANRAARKILDRNGQEELKPSVMELRKETLGENRYYEVKLVKRVPFSYGRMILPAAFLPDGWTVSAHAWAMAGPEPGDRGIDMHTQLHAIMEGQTYNEFFEIQDEMEALGYGSSARVEARKRSESSKGAYYTLDEEGNPIRREYVHLGRDLESLNPNHMTSDGDRADGKNKTQWLDMRDLYVNVKPDVMSSSLMPNWDVGDEFLAGMKLANTIFSGVGTDWYYKNKTKAEVIAQIARTFERTEEKAAELLERFLATPIRVVIGVSHPYTVRGTPEELKAMWQEDRKSVATDFKGKLNREILANDPLLVRIESEELNAKSSGYYTNSAREYQIDIKVDNLSPMEGDSYKYRPLAFFYSAPLNVYSTPAAGARQAKTLILNLEADFRGIVFAPESPVQVLGNGHKFQGLIVAKSIMGPDGVELEMADMDYASGDPLYQDFYTRLGLSDAAYDSFGLVRLKVYPNPGKDIVYLTERAKVTE